MAQLNDLILGFEKMFERKIAKSTIGTILAKSDASPNTFRFRKA